MKTIKLILGIFILAFASCSAPKEPADKVFTNGKVYTVNDAQPWAEAVAIKGNKIVFVGSNKEAKAFIGDSTVVEDLGGKMMLPGFISAHDHLVASGWMNLGVQLYEGKSLDDYLKTIKEYADQHPEEEVIRGIGWNIENTGGSHPTAAMLDKVVPNRRAIMIDYTGHDAWLNTMALEAGGITKDTPDPHPGVSYWVRDDQGNPLGGATEVSWMPAYVKMGAWEPETMIPEVQKKHYATIVSYGMTAFLNPGIITPRVVDPVGSVEDHEAAMTYLANLENKGELTVRTFTQPVFKTTSVPTDEFIGRAAGYAKKYNGDKLRSFGIKIHPEGTFNAKTSWMLEPYEGTHTHGSAGVKTDRMKELILAANEAGLDVVIHVDGSATARGTIDAIEAVRKVGYTDARNAIHHYYWVHPDDQKRVEAMKIPLNISPIFYTDWSDGDKPVVNLLGEKRTQDQFGKFLGAVEAGCSVSLAADVPSAPLSIDAPLLGVESAITRRDPLNEDSKVFPAGARGITLEQAIKAITINPAWQIRMEDKLGSLEEGKLADLVVLDKNLFDIDPTEISEVKVLMTMMDGVVRYQEGL